MTDDQSLRALPLRRARVHTPAQRSKGDFLALMHKRLASEPPRIALTIGRGNLGADPPGWPAGEFR